MDFPSTYLSVQSHILRLASSAMLEPLERTPNGCLRRFRDSQNHVLQGFVGGLQYEHNSR